MTGWCCAGKGSPAKLGIKMESCLFLLLLVLCFKNGSFLKYELNEGVDMFQGSILAL